MSHNLDATVFVYRHLETGQVCALYADDARAMTGRSDHEHVATLEPRMWIEAHYDDVAREREACAKAAEDTARYCSSLASRSMVLEAAAAIRIRSTTK